MEVNFATYKPKPLRVIIENSIAYLVILVFLEGSNPQKFVITDLLNCLGILSTIYFHNTYLLKSAIQQQKWLTYAVKLFLYLFVLFPMVFYLVDSVQYLIDHKPFHENPLLYYKLLIIIGTLCTLIGSAGYLVKYFAIERQMRLQAELLLKKQQLLLLQSQINPHFLFNSLNTIKALTASNPGKAREAIVQLSELLRKSLNTTTNSFISVADELETVKGYLSLEKQRYGDRLEYAIDVDPNIKNVSIPSMSLQMLIENAIKHGVNKSMEGGNIAISIYENDANLCVSVENTGQLRENKTNTGIGVQNIIKQLKLLYNDNASFSIANTANNTVIAKLVLPIMQN